MGFEHVITLSHGAMSRCYHFLKAANYTLGLIAKFLNLAVVMGHFSASWQAIAAFFILCFIEQGLVAYNDQISIVWSCRLGAPFLIDV